METKSMVSFEINDSDFKLVRKIVERAAKKRPDHFGKKLEKLDLEMDLVATHSNGNPLDFQKILDADDFNFGHDVYGIVNHIDRRTGKLTRCFLPRYSRPR
jgi:hypothetical protein